MGIRFLGKPGSVIEYDTGAERFKLNCPVPAFRFYVSSVKTSLEFVLRSDIGRLELTGLAIYPNWRAAAAVRKGHTVALHFDWWGPTTADFGTNTLSLSAMDTLNVCCLCLAAYPNYSDAWHRRWQRSLMADAGADADSALRQAWAAIHWPNQRNNPELMARLRNILDHYPADVAGYRAAAR